MAAGLIARGYKVLTGGTDNHMLLVDLRGTRIDAARAERALHAAHIAVNRASLPGETGSEPTQGDGGLRLGTPAVTTRGLAEPEIRALSGWVADVLDSGGADRIVARVRTEVLKMCAAFPVYGAQSGAAVHDVAVCIARSAISRIRRSRTRGSPARAGKCAAAASACRAASASRRSRCPSS